MPSIRPEMSRYALAAVRGVDWLSRQQHENGHYQHCSRLRGYYKSPLAFALLGRSVEGVRALSWAQSRFSTPEGHIQDLPADPGVQPRRCDLYEDLWLAWGAFQLGRVDVGQRVFSFVQSLFDGFLGGFSSSVSRVDGNLWTSDLRSTALGGLVANVARRSQVAERAADFVVELLALQQGQADGLYLVRDRRGRLVTDFPADLERYFVLREGQRRPLYYAPGLAVCLLATLYQVTHRRRYLVSAMGYAELCSRFAPEIYLHDYSGKLCWGLAILARCTGEDSYRRDAMAAADHLCGRQSADGFWNDVEGTTREPCATLDLTAEYSVWLRLVAEQLGGSGQILVEKQP